MRYESFQECLHLDLTYTLKTSKGGLIVLQAPFTDEYVSIDRRDYQGKVLGIGIVC